MERVLNLLGFFHETEGLKKELRHSWLSDGRQESVAEHSWRLALMIMVISPEIDIPINTERALRMAIVHDLCEVYAKDNPAFNDRPDNHQENERAGLVKIIRNLPHNTSNSIKDLWEEFERCETPESRLVKALDKVEVLIQHNEADISTWNEKERQRGFNLVYGDEYCTYDEFLCKLKNAVRGETDQKLQDASI